VGENVWTHLGIVAVPAIMIVAMWLDNRRNREEDRQRTDDRHREEEKKASDRHTENVQRLASIEVKIDPMWDAWNKHGFRAGDTRS
jgi:hypothetical protein